MTAMMAAAPMNDFYADEGDAHSLVASIEDFEDQERRSPLLSGFRSEHGDSELDDRSSTGLPWSPPGFKHRNTSVSGWFRQDPYGRYDLRPSMSPSRSRQTSPELYQDATEGDQDITIAVNTPLPAGNDSPTKERSPEPEPRNAIHDIGGSEQPESGSGETTNNCECFLSCAPGT